MAAVARDRINILVINREDSSLLVELYAHYNLKIAFLENLVWVKNIPDELISSATIQRIPSQRMYATAEGLLYPYGKLIPVGDLPDLTWQPIQQGLTVVLPAINPNYFGVQEQVPLQLVTRTTPEEALFLLVNLVDLKHFLETAAAWRIAALKWTLVGNYHALLQGQPLATLSGQPYWRRGQHILPLGLDLEWPILHKAIAQHLAPKAQHWILWQKNGQYGLLPKIHFKPLSRSGFYYTKSLLQSSNPT